MATSAFKSKTKRPSMGATTASTTVADSSSSTRTGTHRRSRSLSRFSHRLRPEEEYEVTPASKGRFVNKARGSEFLEISLDDLANEFMESVNRCRSPSRNCDLNLTEEKNKASMRRGRSVSRRSSGVGDGKTVGFNGAGGGKIGLDSNLRRRRSVSVVRYQISDSESDREHSQKSSGHSDLKRFSKGNGFVPSSQKPTASSNQRILGRSSSYKDFSKLQDGYSSQSSALTDDETREARSCKNGSERTIQAVYAQKKTEHPIGDDVNGELYEVMRKELRHAVEEIRMDLEQERSKTNSPLRSSGYLQSRSSYTCEPVSTMKKNSPTKLNQSERCKQDLLAELLLEEKQGKEHSKFVNKLNADAKNNELLQNPSCYRKKSKDRSRMSKQLTDEAEKYFEDFLSNVEDTDISSHDGERSDSSSTLGVRNGTRCSGRNETFQTPVRLSPLPVEMDGVVLPWLQWETSNDASPLSCKKMEAPVTPKPILWDATQDLISVQEQSNYPASSRGSCSPGVVNGSSMKIGRNLDYCYKGPGSNQNQYFSSTQRTSQFDADVYLNLKGDEELLFERWNQQHRINSGGLLLCHTHL